MMDSARYTYLLASVPPFAALGASELQVLYKFCALQVFSKGERVTHAGGPIDTLGIVVSGRLAEAPPGASSFELGRGQAVEADAYFKRLPAGASYVALRETVLLTLAWEDFLAAIHASPKLLAACFAQLQTAGPEVPVAKSPARLAIFGAGAESRLDEVAKDALLHALEARAEIRLLGRESFGGGMPGAINLAAPETAHWLQQQELKFDLTVLTASDLDYGKAIVEEADEILFIASEGKPSLSAIERHALDTRGGKACRLAIATRGGLPVAKANAWIAPRPYRSTQVVEFASPPAVGTLASALLGQGCAVAATSRGVHAAAVLGALQAFEAQGSSIVSLVAAGSAILPVGLFACAASLKEAEAIFGELCGPSLWKRSSRYEASLFEPAAIDQVLSNALLGFDVAAAKRPLAVLVYSLSADRVELRGRGALDHAVRCSILPIGMLPPAVAEDGSIIVSAEGEIEALLTAAKTLTEAPIYFLHSKPSPLGILGTRSPSLSSLRLGPFQSHAPLDKRLRLESMLGAAPCRAAAAFDPISYPGQVAAKVFQLPIAEGVMPMDWSEWKRLRDKAYDWMSAALDRGSGMDSEKL